MPELLEIESYRRLAEKVSGRRCRGVEVPDPDYVRGSLGPVELDTELTGVTITAARRRGKLLLLDTDGDITLGLRFGMTGRLLVDGEASIVVLQYASTRDDPAWVRFRLCFEGPGRLEIIDPRRLGWVEADPDEGALGPDATTITISELTDALRSTVALKARLLDQRRIAGLGNLLADDVLWRAGLDPARASDSLAGTELVRLLGAIRETLAILGERGGSHTGDLQAERHPEGHCPLDGAALLKRTIGGRSTYSCRLHQT